MRHHIPSWSDRGAGNAHDRAVPALELLDIVKEYPGTPPVRALDRVSLRIEDGELCAIVGPSGSGKSTMLHIIGTLDRPTSGQVWIAGHEVSRLPDRRLSAVRSQLIGFVFQQFHLIDGMTAVDNVANGLLYRGIPISERREQAQKVLQQVGLGHRADHVPNQLSGGEKQRVAVARAIINRPTILLADEPTGNLDSHASASIVELLRELHEAGSTVIVITHNPELADVLPRQVAVRDGEIEHDSAGTFAGSVGR